MVTVELAIVPSVRLGSWSVPRARGMTNDVAYRGTGPGAMVGSGGLGGGVGEGLGGLGKEEGEETGGRGGDEGEE